MRKSELQKELNKLVTIKDLMLIFGVKSRVTINSWRSGSGKGAGVSKYELKVPGNERGNIRFQLSDILQFAKKEGIPTPGLKKWKSQK